MLVARLRQAPPHSLLHMHNTGMGMRASYTNSTSFSTAVSVFTVLGNQIIVSAERKPANAFHRPYSFPAFAL